MVLVQAGRNLTVPHSAASQLVVVAALGQQDIASLQETPLTEHFSAASLSEYFEMQCERFLQSGNGFIFTPGIHQKLTFERIGNERKWV